MRIFLLVMLLYMFIKRIRYTPRELSYRIWKSRLIEDLKKLDDTMKEIKLKSIEEFGTTIVWDCVYISAIILTAILYILYIITYSLVGSQLGNTYLLILSAIQIILTWCGLGITFRKNCLSTNIEDYKFRRWLNLINVIVDYIYYPVAIWMLLTM